MINNRFFFFKLASSQGLEDMLENGPYMIWNVHIILKKWSPNVSLAKEHLTRVPVWVKLHNVLMVAFTSDRLSMIATKLGNPIMLDSYTSSICMESWGHGSFARVLIELDATCGLKDMLVVAIPKMEGSGFNHSLPKQEMPKYAYENKTTTSTLMSNAFFAIEEDNGKYMDELVDDTRKK
ncbi:zinc knuckle CX2CX4HX4C containing protein [Tanacetum coccineum]